MTQQKRFKIRLCVNTQNHDNHTWYQEYTIDVFASTSRKDLSNNLYGIFREIIDHTEMEAKISLRKEIVD